MQLTEPWVSGLAEFDRQLSMPISLTCMGGFAMTIGYGMPRATVDIDACSLAPLDQSKEVDELAGRGSPLHRKYGIYIQQVNIVSPPCDHTERLIPIEAPTLQKLKLFVLEAHDLALSKLERNSQTDREDVRYLVERGLLDSHTLQLRYYEEQRSYLIGDLRRFDRAFDFWLQLYWPEEFPS
ncbi:DUF6036 family nucleotidyltransferase [Bryobacter aggregatus]|uniref:DUF6036 family nucleotidyltransferase n=1 Tax=Bryobacter aggregatus TaxID=360054 RepID=UPI0004E27678|nr:DUF6036 family nucleotidyltransferase [Bryobacter aggregatus]